MNKPWKPDDCGIVIPYLIVRDSLATAKFYESAFGFVRQNVMSGPNGKIYHIDMTHYGEAVIMFSPEDAPYVGDKKSPATSGVNSPANMYVYFEDVDAAFKRAVAAGAIAGCEPADMFWGDRICSVTDPDGYEWSLATKVGEFDESKMPNFDAE